MKVDELTWRKTATHKQACFNFTITQTFFWVVKVSMDPLKKTISKPTLQIRKIWWCNFNLSRSLIGNINAREKLKKA